MLFRSQLPNRPRSHHRQKRLCESKKIPPVTSGALSLWRVDRDETHALSAPNPELQTTKSMKSSRIRHHEPHTLHQDTVALEHRRWKDQRRRRNSCKSPRINEQRRRGALSRRRRIRGRKGFDLDGTVAMPARSEQTISGSAAGDAKDSDTCDGSRETLFGGAVVFAGAR